jgi:D-psicose/D-tagatose/L-ribulose 3-epimerase
MSPLSTRDAYFSFFMFTVDLRPDDAEYRQVVIGHIRELTALGYAGFDLPIAPGDTSDHDREIESYREFKRALDEAGLADVKFTTNVAATSRFDPTSSDPEQRDAALAYLKSRVDISAALGADIMAGPIVFPYNGFPVTDSGEPIWSNALQEWLAPGYRRGQPVLNELGEYAQSKNVKIAIEPVDHWEQPAPNSVEDVLDFLEGVPSRQVGVCVDSAHVVLSGGGPETFDEQIRRAAQEGRLTYVHVSAPDRGAVQDSWIPWEAFFTPISASYEGPLLIENFNAIAAFLSPLQITRRKFWVRGEDPEDPGTPDAYTVAREALATMRERLRALEEAETPAVPRADVAS